jgi:GNAT superfamily N-acetyltransferase
VSRDWQIRRIRAGEGLKLRALRLQALADAPTAFGSTLAREEQFADELWHTRACNAAAGLASITVIAEHADRWVGMASGLLMGMEERDRVVPVLVGMFVATQVRRFGIGVALVESIMHWARAGGHDQLYLWAVSANAPALALYRRCGFQVTGVTRPLSHIPDLTEQQMAAAL